MWVEKGLGFILLCEFSSLSPHSLKRLISYSSLPHCYQLLFDLKSRWKIPDNCNYSKSSQRICDNLHRFLSFDLQGFERNISGGIVSSGQTQNLADPFKESNWNPGPLAMGFYGGLWSYAGWDILNYGTPEIRNPRKFVFPRILLITSSELCHSPLCLVSLW